MKQWFVGVAVQGRDELASEELFKRGFEVLTPRTHEKRTFDKKRGLFSVLHLSPYFYLRFYWTPDFVDEYAVALKTRGVRSILLNDRGNPGSIPNSLIRAERAREHSERNDASAPSKGSARTDLVLMNNYIILRHKTMTGQIGKLIASEHSTAYLAAPNGIKISLPDCDIAPHGWKPVELGAKVAA